MPHTGKSQRRREKRTRSVRTLRYHSDGEPCGTRRCLGLSLNVSSSGLCMYAGYSFEPGAVLRVSLPRSEPRQATVRWCRQKVESRLYVLGLSFR